MTGAKNRWFEPMKLFNLILTGGALIMGTGLYAADSADTNKATASDREKASYGVGVNVAQRFKHEFIDLDIDAFIRGFRDKLSEKEAAFSDQEIEQALLKLRDQVAERSAKQGEQNKKEAQEFLEKNKTEKGVVALPSGLQYQVIREGTGASPKASDTVRVHYQGTLLNGTEFDSSYKRGEPAVFPVGQVIPGWVEGLQKMKTGAKYKFWIPSELAYGDQGQPPIPPGSMLTFEVELLGIESDSQQ